ncbi:MAG: Rab proteins geranylgeranyltransferase component A [Sclerophora amabilis]|nr:MAG: Rab proteins geranylgeranyltransferase component A [Sclerophora amabilis]
MESLEETTWDAVISGTGIQQSLLALALSRSGKKVLHVDKNDFYGGPDAALSLQEAGEWASKLKQDSSLSTFSNVSVSTPKEGSVIPSERVPKLSYSRAYSLSLSPQLIYTRSRLLPLLVSSRVYRQLEFQAVGPWWVFDATEPGAARSSTEDQLGGVDNQASGRHRGFLRKVPSGREDVFTDASIDLKSKRSLMKFLKFVGDYENQRDMWEDRATRPFPQFLSTSFKLPPALHAPLLAITMSPDSPELTTTAYALPRIARHLRSIGVFGPGFGAVIPKWGGGSEIAQVACRAGAVGGGVYVLGKPVEAITDRRDSSDYNSEDSLIEAHLQGGDKVKTKWIIGTENDLPQIGAVDQSQTKNIPPASPSSSLSLKTISVVSSALQSLFSVTAEGGPPPAGAVVVIPSTGSLCDSTEIRGEDGPPVYVIVHSSETGECPAGQSVLYASMLASHSSSYTVLDHAIRALLDTVQEDVPPEILYSLRYTQHGSSVGQQVGKLRDPSSTPSNPSTPNDSSRVLFFPLPSLDLAFDDNILDHVKDTWKKIMSDTGEGCEGSEDEFMVFEDREDFGDDEGFSE